MEVWVGEEIVDGWRSVGRGLEDTVIWLQNLIDEEVLVPENMLSLAGSQELEEELVGEHPGPVHVQHNQVGEATRLGANNIL